MASFYLWSIKWSRKSGTEDLESVGNSFPNSLKLLKDSLRVATKLSYIYISQLQHKMKLKKKKMIEVILGVIIYGTLVRENSSIIRLCYE